MILSGLEIVTRQLVRNLQDIAQQQQPCGIDLTLRQVSEWTSAATIDFDNTKRQAARISSLPFDNTSPTITLQQGAYLVDFNETVKIPRNCMAHVFPRSSLWRSSVRISAGVVDAGYEGAMGALMEVKNPKGIVLYKDAKLAQIVLEEIGERVDGYSGIANLHRVVLDAMGQREREPFLQVPCIASLPYLSSSLITMGINSSLTTIFASLLEGRGMRSACLHDDEVALRTLR